MIKVSINFDDLDEEKTRWESKSAIIKKISAGTELTPEEKTVYEESKKNLDMAYINRTMEFYQLLMLFEELDSHDIKEIIKKETLKNMIKPFMNDSKKEVEFDAATWQSIYDYIEQFIREKGIKGSWSAKHIKAIKKAIDGV